MTKKIIAAFLALIMAVSAFSACSDTQSTSETVTSFNEDKEFTVTEETLDLNDPSNAKDSLPDLNYDGAVVRFYADDSNHDYIGLNDYMLGPEEISGDVVFDAVIMRNESVQERLNVKFEYQEVSYAYDVVTANTRKIILAGEDLYEIMLEQQYGLAQLVAEGMFLNIDDGKYFNFEQPWWWNYYMDASAIGSSGRFFLAGDFFIDLLRSTYTAFFNKTIFENNFGTTDNLYGLVIDGNWTYDEMYRYTNDVYRDLNGDGVSNEGDLWGMISGNAIVDHFVYGTDLKFTERNKDNVPAVVLNNERAYTLTDKLYKLFFENKGTNYYTDDSKMRAVNESMFYNSQVLFLNYSMTVADRLRDMKDDWGVLPMPKLDETQERYMMLPHDTVILGVIPITSQKFEMTSAVIEALCAESYRSVMPTYYEVALKVKYLRDDLSAQMIDIIHDAIGSDFTYIFSANLNNIGTIYRTLMNAKSKDFASEYSKREEVLITGLDKLIATYSSNS